MGIPVKSKKIERAKISLSEKIKDTNKVWGIIVLFIFIIVMAYPIYMRQSHINELQGPTLKKEDVATFELPVDKVTTSPDEKYQSIIKEQSALIAELKKQLSINEQERNKSLEGVVSAYNKKMEELQKKYQEKLEETLKKIPSLVKNNSENGIKSKYVNDDKANIQVKSADELLKTSLKKAQENGNQSLEKEKNSLAQRTDIAERLNRYSPPVLVNRQTYLNSSSKKAESNVKEGANKKSFVISGAKTVPFKPKPATIIHSYTKNKDAGILPVGSMMPIVLLNGLDAGAGAETQKNPQPIMVRIQKDAIVPVIRGSAKYKLKGCFLLGTGHGDISSERVYIKASRLSCVDPVNKWVVTGQVNGFFADSDNVQGLRGRVEMRDGAKIAKSMLASFVQTMSSVAGQSANTSAFSQVGNALVAQPPSAGTLLTVAGAQGVASAFKILAEKFAKDAANIHPVITVNGGRKAYLIITQTSNLSWKPYSGQFKEEYKLGKN